MVIISKNISPGDYLNSLLADQGLPVLPREKAEVIGIQFEQAVRAADAHEKGLQLLKNHNHALYALLILTLTPGVIFLLRA